MFIQVILNLIQKHISVIFQQRYLRTLKRFQKEFRSTVESILFDYTDEVVEKIVYWDFIIYMKIYICAG